MSESWRADDHQPATGEEQYAEYIEEEEGEDEDEGNEDDEEKEYKAADPSATPMTLPTVSPEPPPPPPKPVPADKPVEAPPPVTPKPSTRAQPPPGASAGDGLHPSPLPHGSDSDTEALSIEPEVTEDQTRLDGVPAQDAKDRPTAGKHRALYDQEMARLAKKKLKEEKQKRRRTEEERDRKGKGEAKNNAEKAARPAPKKPERPPFMKRNADFENTYLGGNAGYSERLRRLDDALAGMGRPHRLAHTYLQDFDPPPRNGVRLHVDLDRTWLDPDDTRNENRRVILQVGLKGSEQYGWRRPPLDVALVIDRSVADLDGARVELTRALAQRLGPQDRLGIVAVGAQPLILSEVERAAEVLRRVDLIWNKPSWPGHGGAEHLARALKAAGELLNRAAFGGATTPGTQTVLFVTQGSDPARVRVAKRSADELTRAGAVTSIIELAPHGDGGWASVANAGYGNYHRAALASVGAAFDAELESLARVVARLLRVVVRLAEGVEAIRVIGSRVLDEEEAKRVRARERAMDVQLSRAQGIDSDRAEDEEGIKTLIPYFYGGDTHVLLFELWVERPGPVADVIVRYKDMVRLRNATASASATMHRTPRESTPTEVAVALNTLGLTIGEQLQRAGIHVKYRRYQQALSLLERALSLAGDESQRDDRALIGRFSGLIRAHQQRGAGAHEAQLLGRSMMLAGERKVGQPQNPR